MSNLKIQKPNHFFKLKVVVLWYMVLIFVMNLRFVVPLGIIGIHFSCSTTISFSYKYYPNRESDGLYRFLINFRYGSSQTIVINPVYSGICVFQYSVNSNSFVFFVHWTVWVMVYYYNCVRLLSSKTL